MALSFLKGKTILIISPQGWHKVRVSKHHYAVALAEAGNTVYFLNPPDDQVQGVRVSESGIPGLHLVEFSTFFPMKIRFRLRKLYDWLMSFQIKKILKKIGARIDVIWCFDPNLYNDLGKFDAQVRIFHPVDVFSGRNAQLVAGSSDVLFSVSPSILSYFSPIGKPSFFINHGLGKDFTQLTSGTHLTVPGEFKHICYVGNMLIPYLDHELVRGIVQAFPDKHFHFVGPYRSDQSTLGDGDHKAGELIRFLLSQPNVTLHGSKGSADLAEILRQMDCFLICYTGRFPGYDLSNSHKILEYLSTGKPVVSSPVLAYQDKQHLLYMPSGKDEHTYVDFFVETISSLPELESEQLMKERRSFALSNTYSQQVERIDQILVTQTRS